MTILLSDMIDPPTGTAARVATPADIPVGSRLTYYCPGPGMETRNVEVVEHLGRGLFDAVEVDFTPEEWAEREVPLRIRSELRDVFVGPAGHPDHKSWRQHYTIEGTGGGSVSDEARAALADVEAHEEASRTAAAHAQAEREQATERGRAMVEALPGRAGDRIRAELAACAEYGKTGRGAVLVLERRVSDTDLHTDYFGHHTTDCMRVAFVGKRVAFREWKRALAAWLTTSGPVAAGLSDDDLAELAMIAESGKEHRENYSMGGGYYVTAPGNWRHSSGWHVSHRQDGESDILADIGRGILPLPEAGQADKPETKPTSAGPYRLERHTHTKRDRAMLVVVTDERTDRDAWQARTDEAKRRGGWYGRAYKPAGFPGGWCWWADEDGAEEAVRGFLTWLAGDQGPDGTTDDSHPEPVRDGSRFRSLGERMIERGAEKAGRDRLENTPKRQREAASQRVDGWREERAGRLALAYADAIEAGRLPNTLHNQRVTKADFLRAAARSIECGPGYYDCPHEGDDWANADPVSVALRELAGDSRAIDSEGHAEAKAAAKRHEVMRQFSGPGYFPTPQALAGEVVDELASALPDGLRGALVLEPSAGSGSLADIARDRGALVHCVEQAPALADLLRETYGDAVTCGDFLAVEPDDMLDGHRWDGVVLNPPFERVQGVGWQAIAHVMHAARFVRPGGALVAIVPANICDHADRQTEKFLGWLYQRKHHLGPVRENEFTGPGAVRSTSVRVRILVIRQ